MTELFRKEQITAARELTNIELRNEALRHKDNPTLELYLLKGDRESQHEEALYVGDERRAAVTWEGTVYLYEDVGSLDEAFDQLLRFLHHGHA